MTLAWFAAVSLFAFAMAMTPGPNNLIATASGATFGLRRTLPQMWGVAIGAPVMLILLGLGVAQAMLAYPRVQTAMSWIGAAYLVWLAWRIATAGPTEAGDVKGEPPTFLQSALFQWVNPKAWVLCLSAIATYTRAGPDQMNEILAIAAIFIPMTFISLVVWAQFGVTMSRWLTSPLRLRLFNGTMAALMLVSLAPLFLSQ
jgi:threonine/homoserine/homoserine lactone efflux protein